MARIQHDCDRASARSHARSTRGISRAAIAAVQTRTPELNQAAAARLVTAAERLAKFHPDEPRDRHGRWTTDGASGQTDSKQTAADQSVLITPVALAGKEGDKPQGSNSPEKEFEEKYDGLGPVDFAKQVIEFGDRLGREGRDYSPADSVDALAEYSFLQDRLSFWLGYDYKPPAAQNNLLSAAVTLYQGAINAGVVHAGAALPHSMLYVGGATGAFENAPPRIPSAGPAAEDPLPPAYVPEEVEGRGVVVGGSETGVNWSGGIKEQGDAWEVYNAKVDPDAKGW